MKPLEMNVLRCPSFGFCSFVIQRHFANETVERNVLRERKSSYAASLNRRVDPSPINFGDELNAVFYENSFCASLRVLLLRCLLGWSFHFLSLKHAPHSCWLYKLPTSENRIEMYSQNKLKHMLWIYGKWIAWCDKCCDISVARCCSFWYKLFITLASQLD